MCILYDAQIKSRGIISMSDKVLIISDSTSDLSPELIKKYGIKIVPLGVNVGGKEYTDGVDINPDMIYENYAKTGELPKTAAVNIAAFTDVFEEYTAQGYSIVVFTISGEMSATQSNARIAASDFDNVYVVDTRNLSTGGGLLVLTAAELAEQGKSACEIAEECTRLASCVDASFVIDSLEFLHKGGRCSAVAAFGANLLNLKPCIVVRGGKMGVAKKYRGRFDVVIKNYIKDQIGDASDIELDHIFVTHAGCDEKLCAECVELVKSLAPFREVHLTRAGCTISSHCGRNTLGVLFIRKQPLA
jgi:DegV family protein with EDD domain